MSAKSLRCELIASGCCDEDKLDGKFAKLYGEEQQLG
jgi:hypothetical protein